MASLPLRQLPIHAFLGEAEGIDALQLADVVSTSGSRNVWMDIFGHAATIAGYSRVTPTPELSETGSATIATALCHYVKDPGGVTVRQEIAVFDDGVDEWELKLSRDSGATWELLTSSSAVGAIADFAALGSMLIITNGVDDARFWDGDSLQTLLQTQLPAPVLSTTFLPGRLSGTYRVRIVPLVGARRKAGSVVSEPLLIPGDDLLGVEVDWEFDTDPDVTGYEIYSTTGSGGVFYLAGTVDAATNTFTITLDDLELQQNRSLAEHGDQPPAARYVEVHKGRVFYGGLFTGATPLPRAWFFSDPGLADSVYQDKNFFNATDGESFSDATVGATGNFHGRFVIWLERSVWVVSGTFEQTGPIIDARLDRSNAKTGTTSHRTVARVPAGAKYTDERGRQQQTESVMLAYLTPLGDVRLFDGNDDLIISTPKKASLLQLAYEYRSRAFVVDDIQRGEITWVFPKGPGATRCNAAVTWNYRYGIWYDRPLWGVLGCAVAAEVLDDPARLLAAQNDRTVGGLIYRLWNTCTADGEQFYAQWMSKTIYFPGTADGPTEQGVNGASLITHEKRVRWLDIIFQTEALVTLLVEWLDAEAEDDDEALGSVEIAPTTSNLETSDLSLLTSSDDSQLVCVKSPALVRARIEDTDGRYFHGRGIRLRISAPVPS